MTMQQFTARGINFGPTRMVNERNAMATPSERSPQVREPSDCGEQTLFSSLFLFPFPSFLSFFLQADMAMARVNAEPKRQPTRTILSFLSFPPNLGYLFCQHQRPKSGWRGFSSFAYTEDCDTLPPYPRGSPRGPMQPSCSPCTCAEAKKKPCRSEAAKKPCRSGPGLGRGPEGQAPQGRR